MDGVIHLMLKEFVRPRITQLDWTHLFISLSLL